MSQIGGKHVASGGYGCVYRPTLLCKGGTEERSYDKISKLMIKKDAKEEQKESKLIDKIDPTFYFHLPAPTICLDVKEPDVEHDNDFKDCTIFTDNARGNLSRMATLTYEDGGTSLHEFINNLIELLKEGTMQDREEAFLRLFFNMENLFFGLKEMYENRIVHGDIKSLNVVIKPAGDGVNYILKFIDFGLATKINEKAKKFLRNNISYYVYPFEAFFCYDQNRFVCNNVRKNRDGTVDYSRINRLLNRYYGENQKGISESFFVGENIYTSVEQLIPGYLVQLCNGKTTEQQKDVGNKIIAQVDIFSMGIMLALMWAKIFNIKFMNQTFLNYDLETQMKLPLIIREIKNFIWLMLRPMYLERPNGTQLFERFLRIKERMLSLYNPETGVLRADESVKPEEYAEGAVSERKEEEEPETPLKLEDDVEEQEEQAEQEEGGGGAAAGSVALESRMSTPLSPVPFEVEDVEEAAPAPAPVQAPVDDEEIVFTYPSPIIKKKTRECPEGKVFNPRTGRCIKKSGRLAKNLGLDKTRRRERSRSSNVSSIKKRSSRSVSKPMLRRTLKRSNRVKRRTRKVKLLKPCREDQVRNPATRRCIKKTGRLAKKLGLN